MATRRSRQPGQVVGYSDDVMPAPEDWHIDFTARSARVRTATEGGEHVLHLEYESDLDPAIDGALEAARHMRPTTLVLQGVLSFFAGTSVTIYAIDRGTKQAVASRRIPNEFAVRRFEMKGQDLRTDAEKVLMRLQSQDEQADLVASVLDRWRRALYLAETATREEDAGGDSPITAEEIFLHFFHVIELLGDDALKKSVGKIETKVREFVDRFYSEEAMLTGGALKQKVAERHSVIYALLSEDFSVTTKLLRLLSDADAADVRVRSFVSDVVKARNAIAHGRAVFRPKVTWPLPAFFPLHEQAGLLLPSLHVLSARLIAQHCGASLWSSEWSEVKAGLPATASEVKRLLSSNQLDAVAPRSLVTGNHHGVSLPGLVAHYIEGQLDYKTLEKIAGRCLLHVRVSESTASAMLDAAIILADSPDPRISRRARNIVRNVAATNWDPYANPKDFYRYVEHKGRKLTWYRDWLARSGWHRARRSSSARSAGSSEP